VAAADSLADLGVIVLWLGAFILASLAYYLAQAIIGTINISIPFVGKPFNGLATTLQNAIVDPLNDLRSKSDAGIAEGISGLVDSLELLIGLTGLLGLGIYKGLVYLWKTALSPFIHAITDPIRTTANKAEADVTALTKTVADDLTKAETYADNAATKALSSAKSYADTQVKAAIATVESYADEAVSKLRAAEDTAIANAVDVANAAKAAGLAAAAAVESKLEGELKTASSTAAAEAIAAENAAESTAASALAQAQAAASTALGQVKAIAIGAEGDLTDFESYIAGLDLPDVIAGVAALSALLTLVLSDTGLDNASCRSKVKGICGTDPLAWASLLAGIAAIGISFNLGDVVEAALTILDDGSKLIDELGKLADDRVESIGSAIGQAALAIAA
jgi:hypothetical protein